MSHRLRRHLAAIGPALVAGLLAFSGCGASPVGVCQKTCSKTITGLGGKQGQILDCQKNCETGTDNTKGCVNAGDLLSCQDGCLDKPCNEVLGCLGGCPKCVK